MGIQFQANSRISQIKGEGSFVYWPPNFKGKGGYSGKASKNLLSFLFKFFVIYIDIILNN